MQRRQRAEVAGVHSEITVGNIYEQCAYHPVLCTFKEEADDEMGGISLIDGQFRSCSVLHCGPEPLSLSQALEIKRDLPAYVAHRVAGGGLPGE
jgi:hypothetical protein